MTSVAKNKSALKKRVVRFFHSPKRSELKQLTSDLSKIGEVIAFGGVIRDIALYGAKNFNSDIDLVVNCSPESLAIFFQLSHKNYEKNKFGGYRTATRNWTVDVWPLEKTWAFENNKVEFISRESLLRTTITNWDAIAYSFKDGAILCQNDYFHIIKIGEIDLVLECNPNNAGVLLRTLRSIFDGRANKIMPKALSYLKKELRQRTCSEIYALQQKMFGKEFFTESDIERLRQEINVLDENLFGSEVHPKGTVKNLF
jgi:predicted nucleotidyltransferase